jgi:hypothetical protein
MHETEEPEIEAEKYRHLAATDDPPSNALQSPRRQINRKLYSRTNLSRWTRRRVSAIKLPPASIRLDPTQAVRPSSR